MDITKYFKGVPDDDNKVNAAACKSCGGSCCKHMSCHASPSDFIKISKDIIKQGIDEGLFSIDWWEGYPDDSIQDMSYRGYYIRIRHHGTKALDASVGGTCIMLTDKGCSLPFGLRPRGARELIPNESSNPAGCDCLYTKQQCAIDWMPYHDMMEELYQEYLAAGENTERVVDPLEMVLKAMFGITEG